MAVIDTKPTGRFNFNSDIPNQQIRDGCGGETGSDLIETATQVRENRTQHNNHSLVIPAPAGIQSGGRWILA